jgi:hypothetical protein
MRGSLRSERWAALYSHTLESRMNVNCHGVLYLIVLYSNAHRERTFNCYLSVYYIP